MALSLARFRACRNRQALLETAQTQNVRARSDAKQSGPAANEPRQRVVLSVLAVARPFQLAPASRPQSIETPPARWRSRLAVETRRSASGARQVDWVVSGRPRMRLETMLYWISCEPP